MHADKTIKTTILALSAIPASMMIAGFSFAPASADPFGIFNYDNPTLVLVQGLRAHLFEAHDATHMSNSSEIVMHLGMANEEISHFLQNSSAVQSADNQNSTVSTTLEDIQMQLNSTMSVANEGNMQEVMANLQRADEQLAALLPTLGHIEGTNSTNVSSKSIG